MTHTTTRRQFPLSLVALTWALDTSIARAHGDEHNKPTGPVVKEQKPWGIAAEPGKEQRTIEILMTDDMKLNPSHINVREGEILRLRAINKGKLMHEIVIGTSAELVQHAEMMKKFPTMEHDEPYMAHVPPGQRGDIVWTFNRPGNFEFACLIAGHFEAGMRGTIRVAPKA
jgi:uncharacterized cupredoxin-like copper-binding protein